MNKIKNLDVIDTAYGGYGVSKTSAGKVIFTPHTVEGDVIDVEIIDDKKSLAFAKLDSLLSSSAKRNQKPLCKYYDVCGGCLFAHINYTDQIDIKRRIFDNAFRKYKDELPSYDIVHSDIEGYRLRVTMQVRYGKIGYYQFKTREFVAVASCPILKESLFDKILKFVTVYNNFMGEIYAIETSEGLSLASIKTDDELFAITDTVDFDGVEVNGKRSGVGKINYNTHNGAIAITHRSFFQSNRYLLDDFQKYSVSLVERKLSVIELYAGAGFFTAGLIKERDYIIGVEFDETQTNLARVMGYNVIKSDAGKYLKKVKKADVIFLDPPRDGVSKEVIAELKRLRPMNIVYVSCNPVTLGRDVTNLQDDYTVETIKLFDLYPDTHHVESVVKLKRRKVQEEKVSEANID